MMLRLPMTAIRLLVMDTLLALGQIWSNKTRSVLTMLGIIIGVASVIAVVAALMGLKGNVLSEFEALGTNKIFIVPQQPQTGPHKNAPWRVIRFVPELFDQLKEHCPSVSQVTRIVEFTSQARHGDRSLDGVRVVGIEPAWHKIENRSLSLGRPFSLIDETQSRRVCLINEKVRDELRLDRDCVGQTVFVQNLTYRVVGMVNTRVESSMFGRSAGAYEIFIPFNTAWKGQQPWLYVIATSMAPEASDGARAEIRFFLRRQRRLKPGQPDTFRLEVIEQYLKQFEKMAFMLTAVAAGIVTISLLVGGVGIMNIMLVSVSERTREIGLRKAVGATPVVILLQFLVEAMILCLFGGMLGILGGGILTFLLTQIPGALLDKAYIPWPAIVLSFTFCAFVGVAFGLFPAIKAASLDPIEALRHE